MGSVQASYGEVPQFMSSVAQWLSALGDSLVQRLSGSEAQLAQWLSGSVSGSVSGFV